MPNIWGMTTDQIIQANRVASIETLKAQYRAEIAANDRRLARLMARVAGWATLAPATLGALNVAGVL